MPFDDKLWHRQISCGWPKPQLFGPAGEPKKGYSAVWLNMYIFATQLEALFDRRRWGERRQAKLRGLVSQ